MKKCLNCNECFQTEVWTCPKCQYTPDRIKNFLAFAPYAIDEQNTYEANFFADLVKIENGHFWFEARNRLLLWALTHYFPLTSNYLEIGCGTGFVLSAVQRAFPQINVVGADIFLEALEIAAARTPRATLLQIDAYHLPFENEFDVIGAFDVIEHLEQDVAVLSQLFEAVRPGGGIMLTVPQHPFLWSEVDVYSRHRRRYTRHELTKKVEQAGFEVMMATSFVSLLVPAMFLKRRRAHHPSQSFDLLAEFRVHPTVNRLLRWVMNIEGVLLRGGVRFPIGGSLLLIAKRVA